MVRKDHLVPRNTAMSNAEDSALRVARDRVVEEIELAFSNVELGSGVTLHEADLEHAGTVAEVVAARHMDPERRWQDVSDEKLERLCPLPFLDPEGWRFYVPAFMRWSIRFYDESDSVTSDWTIYTFSVMGAMRDRAKRRWAMLDVAQCRAVCSYLRFMVEHGDGYVDSGEAAKALRRDWRGYC
jgi:hypothetical protein